MQKTSFITDNRYYSLLKLYKRLYPELTLDNKGYEGLPLKIKEDYARQIEKISEILRKNVEGFVSFQNFKPRVSGSFAIRCQVYYDPSFIGVHYIDIEDFKEK